MRRSGGRHFDAVTRQIFSAPAKPRLNRIHSAVSEVPRA
jgi:hypothetical protein